MQVPLSAYLFLYANALFLFQNLLKALSKSSKVTSSPNLISSLLNSFKEEVDLVNKTATLKEHVDILDNTEEDDYDYVINVKKLSDSEAKLLGDIYYQMVVIDPVSSSDLVREMIGIDDGWDYENETWDEYKERITVYSTNYNGETLYIYGVDWIRMLSYLFEE